MASVTEWPDRIRHYITSVDVELPQRVILCTFGFLAVVNMYVMRYVIDMALLNVPAKVSEAPAKQPNKRPIKLRPSVVMTRKSKPPSTKGIRLSGGGTMNTTKRTQKKAAKTTTKTTQYPTITPPSTGQLTLPKEVHSMPLMAFYLGYAITHIPGAMLVERYGGKRVLVVAVSLTAIFTILTPMAIHNAGPYSVICLRLMIGLCEGPTFPALCSLLAQWVPSKERGTLGALALSGGQLAVFLMSIMAPIAEVDKNHWIFYAIGVCSLVWVGCFCVLCYNEPSTNPYITEDEKNYLQTEIKRKSTPTASTSLSLTSPPWADILSSVPIWAVISAAAQYDWTEIQQFSDITNLIQGIREVKNDIGYNLHDAIPFLLKWLVSLLAGVLSDVLVNCEILSTTATRRLMTSIVGLGSIVSSNDFGHLYCSLATMGAYYASIILTPLDMSPNYASCIMAVINGVGTMSGTLALYLQSINAETAYTKFNEFRAAIWLICTILISGDIQAFNDAPEQEPENVQTENST